VPVRKNLLTATLPRPCLAARSFLFRIKKREGASPSLPFSLARCSKSGREYSRPATRQAEVSRAARDGDHQPVDAYNEAVRATLQRKKDDDRSYRSRPPPLFRSIVSVCSDGRDGRIRFVSLASQSIDTNCSRALEISFAPRAFPAWLQIFLHELRSRAASFTFRQRKVLQWAWAFDKQPKPDSLTSQ
jgi:hypothetical protein